jgi:DNA-binding XRE family transcriptional regulator
VIKLNGFPKVSLEAARVNAGLTQKRAAELLNITPQTLASYEKGKTVPDLVTAKNLEKIYNFPLDYIFFPSN